ncbi:MAG: sugar ABC transporter ATP-binding protein [Treponema sp.]|jgi:ABC-type sugar transport system ATPase subunit|nr:sugar ABC transporter ATP-binding protein [Treponema sp.]
MAYLELVNVSKSFGGIYALKKASLACERGEVHALLGENGAGKSTLLKILSGALQADEGEIRIDGRPVRIRNPADAMDHGIGTVYQELSIIPDLTVSENIFIGRIPKNRAGRFLRKELRRKTEALFREYLVTDIDPDEKAGGLSLSKRQMIEILRVLSKKPEIIILDEATSALTENKVQWLLSLSRKLATGGRLVIFISHRMSEIKDGCDTITILRNGMTVETMKVENVDMDLAVSMMLGRKIEGYYPELTSHACPEKVLEVKHLQYEHILNNISFCLHKGEVLGLGGLAGQGQAELLLALFGVVKSKNAVELEGRSYKIKSPQKSIQNGIALIPEDRGAQGLLLSFSIMFNIALSSLPNLSRGLLLDRTMEKAVVNRYMDILQVKAPDSETTVRNLSGGNQQKVVLAKMLATKPRIILMHDVTRGVDVGTKKDIFTLVRDLAAQGNSIIYFSTDVEELVNVCDRILVMFDGTIGASFSGGDITQKNIVAASIGELNNIPQGAAP